MNCFKVMLARIYQFGLYVAQTIVRFPEPKLFQGEGASNNIYQILKEKNINRALLVVDDNLYHVPFTNEITNALVDNNIEVNVFHNFKSNPTINNVEEGLKIYNDNRCKAVIGLGGGSSIDIAKAIIARAANPKKSLEQMKGILKVHHKLPLSIAIPTTAGTGSEATIATVITNSDTHHKYAINDPKLIPDIAVLDPKLLVKLPSQITSTTGMDALTHAIEAYINHSHRKRSDKNALEAIKLIYENLYHSWLNPNDLKRRSNMQLAAYKAGVAFTNAYVGNIHALSHALSGQYNVPHGLANSLILPIVLKKYGKAIYRPMAKIYNYIGMGALNISKKENLTKGLNRHEYYSKK